MHHIIKPKCFGTKEHKNVPICRRCDFYVKCYKAMKRNNASNKKRINAEA